jgi:hypothetical protein
LNTSLIVAASLGGKVLILLDGTLAAGMHGLRIVADAGRGPRLTDDPEYKY